MKKGGYNRIFLYYDIFILIFIVLVVIALSWFLYVYFYAALLEPQAILELRRDVLDNDVDLLRVEEAIKGIEDKANAKNINFEVNFE